MIKSKQHVFSTIDNQDEFISARYLSDNKTALYRRFPYREHLSKSSFFKYLRAVRQYKKPTRLTDLCDYCEWANRTARKFNEIARTESYICGDAFEPTHFKNFLKQRILHYESILSGDRPFPSNLIDQAHEKVDAFKNMLPEIDNYKEVMFHKFVASSQREAYNTQRKSVDILSRQIIIEADFKQKIPIGMGPRQPNKEYYEQVLRNCLGWFTF